MSGFFKRIISGGQTGVDRAALDAAMEFGIPCGGWCPKGRIAEDGRIDDRYPLEETPSAAYEQRTMWNVRDADATLILALRSPLSGGTKYTVQVADGLGKPRHIVLLDEHPSLTIAADWLQRHSVGTLNVAGPRESGAPGAYHNAHVFLANLLRFLGEDARFGS